jgi:hypothetical protein
LLDIIYLSDCFGVILERGEDLEDNTRYVVSLVFIDLYRLKCNKFHTLEYVCNCARICVSMLDPTKFVLNVLIANQIFARICKIVVGDLIEFPGICAYFEGRLYGLKAYPSGLIRVCSFFKAFRNLNSLSTMSISKPKSLLKSICLKNTIIAP